MDQCCVCGSEVDRYNPPAQENYQGQVYNFCCEECKARFDANPTAFANRKAA
jgi:YHS domain-containing protein